MKVLLGFAVALVLATVGCSSDNVAPLEPAGDGATDGATVANDASGGDTRPDGAPPPHDGGSDAQATESGADAASDAAPDAGPDVTAPLVTLATNPATPTISSYVPSFSWSATATDNVGVTKVDLFMNGALAHTRLAPPYAGASFPLTAAQNGPLVLLARAYDAAGNTAEATATFTVAIDATPPAVTLSADVATVTLPGGLRLSAMATDNKGVQSVAFYRGATLLTTVFAPPYELVTLVTEVDNGPISYSAVATDADHNTTTSATLPVTVAIPTSTLKYLTSGASGPFVAALSSDSTGAVVAAGNTFGDVGGGGGAKGTIDLFVRKYTAAGAIAWTRQVGVAAKSSYAWGAAVDASDRIAVGGAVDGVGDLRVYSATGVLQWERAIGSKYTEVKAVAIDAAQNVVVAGNTTNLDFAAPGGNTDAFVRAYSPSGTLLWSKQFGTAESDQAAALAIAPNGTIFTGGKTSGSLHGPNAGGSDPWVRGLTSQGVLVWGAQWGGAAFEDLLGLATDSASNVIAGGGAGEQNGFIQARNAAGALLWTYPMPTAGVMGLAVLPGDRIVATAATRGSLYRPVFEPYDSVIVGLDSGGTLLFGKQLSWRFYESDRSIAVTPAGFVIGGFRRNIGGSDWGFVWSFDADGNAL